MTKKPVKVSVTEEYSFWVRVWAGVRRALKYLIVTSPILIDWLTPLEVPYKEQIVAFLVFVGTLEKVLQKDKTKK